MSLIRPVRMGENNEFYLTVDNEDSLYYFTSNKCENFYVKLPYVLQLTGQWSVCVNQVWFKKGIYNIVDCALQVIDKKLINYDQNDVEDESGWTYIPKGFYKDVTDLLPVLNDIFISEEIDEICKFGYDNISCKIHVTISEGFSLVLNSELCNVLGFTQCILEGNIIADRCLNLHSMDDLIYIYTNIISPQMFGNSLHNVLKILDISSVEFGGIIFDTSITNYARVAINTFDVIHFEIRNVNRKRINTQNARIIIQLHFRKDQ